ncbi:hypothetical protein BHE74_00003771 [Ensete ventricosum]|nr:hypothetical protein BHE74_00003771 [Ensete ventricosum]
MNAGQGCGSSLKGEAQEAVKEEFIEILKPLGGRAGGLLSTWAGDAFGFDVSWFYSYETCAGFSTEEAGPKVVAWDKRCTEERESAANALSDPTRCTRPWAPSRRDLESSSLH